MSNGKDKSIEQATDKDNVAHCAVAGGMTKREMFAMAAMEGFIAYAGNGNFTPRSMAAYSLEYADALLEALSEGHGDE